MGLCLFVFCLFVCLFAFNPLVGCLCYSDRLIRMCLYFFLGEGFDDGLFISVRGESAIMETRYPSFLHGTEQPPEAHSDTPTQNPCHVFWVLGKRLLFVSRLISMQHARVSQERICSRNCTCCHTETEAAGQAVYLTP